MTKRAAPESHDEFFARQKRLHIEVTSITSQIIFGDLLWKSQRMGQVHLFRGPRLKKTIAKLREMGLPVVFPDIVRNTK